ncbi:F0F1 ATP synthase subunit alpha [candidate division WOR-1 bacterium RIFCSPLOWO2_02_FULL_46_20]|uniref:ATP synthase subunit alpha n=1 Tax=candidate division WOR-1 bacterium RIFCSPLOWO2_02_FULL_46_20 TaxID=1802567 RepID=A0A1F4RCG9_UNCSA|nr:MAG: F0F1 ATP synthase subunit alpha [candidate division WOR-1 bacterium RIFCSPLOWO2_02_FULL_46_20]
MKENIAAILKKKIEDFTAASRLEEVGYVLESGDGIVRLSGLPSAMSNEMIEFTNKTYGIAFNLEREQVVAVLLGQHTAVKEGDVAKLTGRILEVPVGEALLGRVVGALGFPLDGLGEIKTQKSRPVEKIAPQVVDRTPVNQPLQTGYKAIDALIPIGRGQRELIIGDRASGKSTMSVDAILNQKNQNVYCFYVAIGQKESNIVQLVQKLREHGALDYTTVISAPASDPASMQYLAPYAGCAMAEEFMYNGKDALIIYDDLTKHAQAYRMISLLLRRPPGREAYPGDVFYLHSRLLERSAKLSPKAGGGSLTALPLIETQLGDITSYIPTNVISITDGQIFLEPDLFNQGTRPAVNVGISVSRVGGNAQVPAMRKIAGRLRIDLAQYREKKSFALFAGEVDKETLRQLNRGAIISEVLNQDKHQTMSIEDQIIVIYAAVNNYLDEAPLKRIKETENQLIKFVRGAIPEAVPKLTSLDQATETKLKKALQSFVESHYAGTH